MLAAGEVESCASCEAMNPEVMKHRLTKHLQRRSLKLFRVGQATLNSYNEGQLVILPDLCHSACWGPELFGEVKKNIAIHNIPSIHDRALFFSVAYSCNY